MSIVLDASAAAQIAQKTSIGAEFLDVLLNEDRVLAPDLYAAEISNVMWKLSRADKANAAIYREMAQDCIDFVDIFTSSLELWQEALIEAQTREHSVYDMLYAILAKRNDARLLTVDKALQKTCKAMGIRI